MHRFWSTIIQPIMVLVRPKVIVEVGCKEGYHTAHLLDFAQQTGAVLHVVDPTPELDVIAFQERGGSSVEFHRTLSLNALPSIASPDVVLIDGDHNWYTVFHELKVLEQGCVESGNRFPLVFLHDVGWPYGRRDLYYNPDAIPAAYRKPYAKKGIRLGSRELHENGGLNTHLYNAIHDHGPQNGVLTAVEDFIAQTSLRLEFIRIPGLHGLGILYDCSLATHIPAFGDFVKNILISPPVQAHVEAVENARLQLAIHNAELRSYLRSLTEQLADTEKQLQEAETHARQMGLMLAKAREQEDQLRAIRSQLHRLEIELQQERERCIQLADQLRVEKSKSEQNARELEQLRSQLGSASRDIERLVNWLLRLDTGITAVLSSRTWRVGVALSKLKTAILGKPVGKGATEYLYGLLGQFRQWNAARQVASKAVRHFDNLMNNPSARLSDSVALGKIGHDGVSKRISIVIPVYNAFDETVACIESVLKHTTHPYRLILVDDRSPDPRIWPMLKSYASAHKHVVAVQNECNVGWTGTVNRGVELAEQDDVVLLNSDTLVTPRWLEKLVDTAGSHPNVGTVTPLSNAAGAFSIPENNTVNELPPGMAVEDMAWLVESLSRRIRPSVPTGNGFCMYVARTAWTAVGGMDQERFPQGYGAENDFCMRASAAGFVHLVDDATFIFHKNSASFQERKNQLLDESKAQLRALHPTYKRLITEWLTNDPLTPFRQELKRAIAEWFIPDAKGRKTVLYIVHDGGGGTVYTNEDLMRIVAETHRCLLLRTGLARWDLFENIDGQMVLRLSRTFSTSWTIDQALCTERRQFIREVCSRYMVDLVHVRHLLANGPEVVRELKALNVPVVFSFHDFYTICPTIQLLDDAGRFCNGICTPGERDCPVSSKWFRDIPHLKGDYVYVWRERVAEALQLCDAYVTTSESTKELVFRFYPFVAEKPFHVIEHGRDLTAYRPCASPVTDPPIRVVYFGALNRAKGTDLVEALMRINQEERGPFEFHILGATSREFNPSQYGGIVHGPYDREDLPQKLVKIAPSLSLVPSIWPETYCHALTESWAAGIPVLASDIGVLRERVQRHGGGWCLDHTDPVRWYQRMVEIVTTPGEWERRREEIQAMTFPTIRDMAAQYMSVYAPLLQAERSGRG